MKHFAHSLLRCASQSGRIFLLNVLIDQFCISIAGFHCETAQVTERVFKESAK